jgi:methionyl aminopeptidase
MLTIGNSKTYVKEDGWSVATVDGSTSAHFEHTIAITDNGPIILSTV